MNPRFLLPALMLFGAAGGWVYYPPPLAADAGKPALLARPVARRYRDRVIPLGCVVLGLGVLLAGMLQHRSKAEPVSGQTDA